MSCFRDAVAFAGVGDKLPRDVQIGEGLMNFRAMVYVALGVPLVVLPLVARLAAEVGP